MLIAPGEPVPDSRQDGIFSFFIYNGAPIDDGAFFLQEQIDRAVARGYPAVVDGVATCYVSWNDRVHGPLAQHNPPVYHLDAHDVDSDNESAPSLDSDDDAD